MSMETAQDIGTVLRVLVAVWDCLPFVLILWSCFRHFCECSDGCNPEPKLIYHILRYVSGITLGVLRLYYWNSEKLSFGIL